MNVVSFNRHIHSQWDIIRYFYPRLAIWLSINAIWDYKMLRFNFIAIFRRHKYQWWCLITVFFNICFFILCQLILQSIYIIRNERIVMTKNIFINRLYFYKTCLVVMLLSLHKECLKCFPGKSKDPTLLVKHMVRTLDCKVTVWCINTFFGQLVIKEALE